MSLISKEFVSADSPESESAASSRYSLADVLTIIPKTKRSQVELLVRTGNITPAWPSPGTGHDRAFDGRNLFEIAVATELIALGFVGQRLARFFRQIVLALYDQRHGADVEYLVLLPSADGPLPFWLMSAADLVTTLGIFPSAYVLNVGMMLMGLRVALRDFEKGRG